VKIKLGKNSTNILIVAIIAISLILATLIFLNSQNPYVLLFVFAFGLNLIPFAGPSNLLIASSATIGLENPGSTELFLIGFIIAIAAALAKGIHYMITFFVSGHLSEKRQARLDADGVKVKRWAFPLLFIAAATPIPDEPVVIPLGLMKYSPAKFFSAYFLGKFAITVPGAFLGNLAGDIFSAYLSPVVMVIISIVLTVAVTIILLKVDVNKLAEKYLKKKQQQKDKASQEKLNSPQDGTKED
jgi:membrane protein YqaA with SNARE-associated domain